MSRSLTVLALSFALLPARAQGPAVPKAPDKAFFAQDPVKLFPVCAGEARRLSFRDRQLKVQYGEILLIQGNRAEAEALFDQARKGAEQDPSVHHWIAQAWRRRGFPQEAMASYDAMVKLEGYWEARKNLLTQAATELVATQPEAATSYMDQAYKLDPKDTDNCLMFARAALLSGHGDLAARYFSHAVHSDPKDAEVWARIAEAYADDQIAHRPR